MDEFDKEKSSDDKLYLEAGRITKRYLQGEGGKKKILDKVQNQNIFPR